MNSLLDRADIIEGLREVISELHRAGETAGIRLVGGAALALRYFDRGVTQDLDALHTRPGNDEAVAVAARKIAQRRGWNVDWLNFEVAQIGAFPTAGRVVEWETLYASRNVWVQVPQPEVLLVMKLRANRPGRDTRDIRLLLGLCDISSLREAEILYEEFYPGDALPERAIDIVSTVLLEGVPSLPETLPPPDLSEK
jgi:hypothetical protein